MRIRRLAAEDAAALQACRLHGLQQSPEAFLTSYDEARDTPLAAVEADLRDERMRYFGAFVDDALVGFMRYVRDMRLARRHTAEVRSVVVRGDHRRRGVARALLATLIDDARAAGLESLTLSVLASNASARALYASAGFVVYGVEPDAVKKGGAYDDQVHLRLALSAA